MSVVRVFARCNDGHYFIGHTCPFDGWSSSETHEVADVAARLFRYGVRPSFERLIGEGLSEHALTRACVAEFPESAAPEAIAPEYLIVGGQAFALYKAPPSFR